MRLPEGTRRLFALDEDTDPGAHPWWIIGRVLDEGDSEDLAWLFAAFGRSEIEAWLRRRGGRRLSLRSRRFWSAALGVPAAPPHPLAEALWPY